MNELAERIDEYLDLLSDLNAKRDMGGVVIQNTDALYIPTGIEKIIEAFGITNVEIEPAIVDRFTEGVGTEKWLGNWKRFYYRGIRFAGIDYVRKVDEIE